jgi:hypothetical protein
MVSTGHIILGNNVINHTKGPAPTSATGHGLKLHLRSLGLTTYDGHTPGTALEGYIPELTYLEGPVPSVIAGHGHFSRPGH